MNTPLSNAVIGAQPWFVGIGLPLIAVMVGVALPVQFAQQSAIGEIKAKVEQFRTDLSEIKIGVDTLNKHLSEKETDPTTLLAKLLGASEIDAKDVPTVLVNGDLIAFPKTEPLRQKFVAAGYPMRSVTPTISGFMISLTRAGAAIP